MRFRKAPAFILKTFPYSETSLIVHALTPGQGHVHLLAKGARRRTARGMQGLEPFCRVEITWVEKEGRELQTLSEAALLAGNGAWRGDLARWAMGCLVFELADRASTAGERHGALFDLLKTAAAEAERMEAEAEAAGAKKEKPPQLWRVAPPGKPHRALAAFLPFAFGVLRAQGLAPQVARCVECDATRPPFPAIDLRQGGVLCAACAGGQGSVTGAGGLGGAWAFTSAPPATAPSDPSDLSDQSEMSDSFFDDAAPAGPRYSLDEGTRRILADWLLKWRPAAESSAAPHSPLVRLSARQARALLGLLDRLAAEHLDAPLKSLPLVAQFGLPR